MQGTARSISTLINPVFVGTFTIVVFTYKYFPELWFLLAVPILAAHTAAYIVIALINRKIHSHEEAYIFHINHVTRIARGNLYLSLTFASSAVSIVYGSGKLLDNPPLLNFCMLLALFWGSYYLANHYIEKASLHSGMFCFAILILAHHVNFAYALGLLVLPTIYWARIELKEHSWLQLMLGTIIGCAIGLLAWVF
jgi:hypothetical protein